jgi:hypothetical protein
MPTPVLRRSKATTLHSCKAKICRREMTTNSRTIGPKTLYVSLPRVELVAGLPDFQRPYHRPYHVACFLAEYPEFTLEQIKGYDKHGRYADDEVEIPAPPRSLWDHLEDDLD